MILCCLATQSRNAVFYCARGPNSAADLGHLLGDLNPADWQNASVRDLWAQSGAHSERIFKVVCCALWACLKIRGPSPDLGVFASSFTVAVPAHGLALLALRQADTPGRSKALKSDDGAAAAADSRFVSVQKDSSGVWWFAHRGQHFLSKGVNHVNNGGQVSGPIAVAPPLRFG